MVLRFVLGVENYIWRSQGLFAKENAKENRLENI